METSTLNTTIQDNTFLLTHFDKSTPGGFLSVVLLPVSILLSLLYKTIIEDSDFSIKNCEIHNLVKIVIRVLYNIHRKT